MRNGIAFPTPVMHPMRGAAPRQEKEAHEPIGSAPVATPALLESVKEMRLTGLGMQLHDQEVSQFISALLGCVSAKGLYFAQMESPHLEWLGSLPATALLELRAQVESLRALQADQMHASESKEAELDVSPGEEPPHWISLSSKTPIDAPLMEGLSQYPKPLRLEIVISSPPAVTDLPVINLRGAGDIEVKLKDESMACTWVVVADPDIPISRTDPDAPRPHPVVRHYVERNAPQISAKEFYKQGIDRLNAAADLGAAAEPVVDPRIADIRSASQRFEQTGIDYSAHLDVPEVFSGSPGTYTPLYVEMGRPSPNAAGTLLREYLGSALPLARRLELASGLMFLPHRLELARGLSVHQDWKFPCLQTPNVTADSVGDYVSAIVDPKYEIPPDGRKMLLFARSVETGPLGKITRSDHILSRVMAGSSPWTPDHVNAYFKPILESVTLSLADLKELVAATEKVNPFQSRTVHESGLAQKPPKTELVAAVLRAIVQSNRPPEEKQALAKAMNVNVANLLKALHKLNTPEAKHLLDGIMDKLGVPVVDGPTLVGLRREYPPSARLGDFSGMGSAARADPHSHGYGSLDGYARLK